MTTVAVTNKQGKILEVLPFKANLNLRGPRYLNEGGDMGLTRNKEGRLVLMYHYTEFPSRDKGEYISEEEAYEICYNRGKQHLIEQLQIKPNYIGEGI